MTGVQTCALPIYLGSWPVAIAALEAIGPEWLLLFKQAVLIRIREITFLMEAPVFNPKLYDELDRAQRVLRHFAHDDTLGVPVDPQPR